MSFLLRVALFVAFTLCFALALNALAAPPGDNVASPPPPVVLNPVGAPAQAGPRTPAQAGQDRKLSTEEVRLRAEVATAQAVGGLTQFFSLLAVSLLALAGTYGGLFLAKLGLKRKFPEYRAFLPTLHLVLVVGCVLGAYFVLSPAGSVASAVGAASSRLLHDSVDGLRAFKTKRSR